MRLVLCSILVLLAAATLGDAQQIRRARGLSTLPGGDADAPGGDLGTVFDSQKIGYMQGGFGLGINAGDRFGSGIDSLGDFDGDGDGDILVGQPRHDRGGLNNGAVVVIFLNPDGTVDAKQKINEGLGGFQGPLAINDQFGRSVACLGDLDDDGVKDIGVGTPGDNGPPLTFDQGAVYVLFMNADGTVRDEQQISSEFGGFGGGLITGDMMGSSTAGIGDLDGDGVEDLATGAPSADGFDPNDTGGTLWIVFLNTNGTVKAKQRVGDSIGGFGADLTPGDAFGASCANLGDLDGDGVVDLAVGAPLTDEPLEDKGVVYVLFMNDDGTVKAEQKIGEGIGGFGGNLTIRDRFGASCAGIGDLDHDGVVDLAVGAGGDDDGGAGLNANRGAIWILLLNTDGTVKEEHKISDISGGFDGDLVDDDRFGEGLGALGDLNGDGIVDLAAGTREAALDNRGAVYLLYLDGLVTIDFETEDDFQTPLANGQDISNPPEFGNLITVEGLGPNTFGAAIFDSTPGGPNAGGPDPDLLVGLGNTLILQETGTQSVPGFYDVPDDAQLGGTLVFDFLNPVGLSSIDLIDIDPGPPLQDVFVDLIDGSGAIRSYFVPDGWTRDVMLDGPPGFRTLDLTTLAPQPGFQSTATASEGAGFDATDVVRLRVLLTSSGALDNLVYDPHPEPAGEPTTITLNAARDNTLIENSSGSLSNGEGTNIFVGRVGLMALGTNRRGVLAFDLGSIPSGATVTDVSLQLFMSQTVSGPQPTALHTLDQAWGEGASLSIGGGGDASEPGDATWIHTFFPGSFWATPGGDFDAAASASIMVDQNGFYTWSSPAMVSDVQGWVDDASSNHGWIIIGNEAVLQTAKRFESRETGNTARRPELTVTYTN